MATFPLDVVLVLDWRLEEFMGENFGLATNGDINQDSILYTPLCQSVMLL